MPKFRISGAETAYLAIRLFVDIPNWREIPGCLAMSLSMSI